MLHALPAPLRREARLVMVGEGPLLGEAQQLVHALALSDVVSLLGVQSHQDVAQLLRGARAFVQHSLVAPDGDSEGSPVSVMEAQLSGLPVVATRHGGIPEVVVEEATGFLVEEGDSSGMAQAMGRLARDPALAGRLGAAGRARATSRFTVQHHLEQVGHLVEEVVAERRRPLRPPPQEGA
jgi:colanic acid/amylovoran biosynthesis glycosyltransferase